MYESKCIMGHIIHVGSSLLCHVRIDQIVLDLLYTTVKTACNDMTRCCKSISYDIMQGKGYGKKRLEVGQELIKR